MNNQVSHGTELIARFVKELPTTPGVYRMINKGGDVIYVGKAKNLKKRVSNYTIMDRNPVRIQRMIHETTHMEFIQTHTETEALLLEANLIKKYKSTYNILLRDDKSFPYIELRYDHDFPMLNKHRGKQKKDAEYFGPFASAGAVNRTLTALQKAFLIRNCSDNVFKNRSRPCLQYQIKRCTAPCVNLVSKKDYAKQIKQAQNFLKGKSHEIQKELGKQMQEASEFLDFEKAALIRDRLKALTLIQSKQNIHIQNLKEADIFVTVKQNDQIAVHVIFFRQGQNYGSKTYFPSHAKEIDTADVLSQFIGQFYDNKPVPSTILTSVKPSDCSLLTQALGTKSSKKITLTVPTKGDKKTLIDQAIINAKQALSLRQSQKASQKDILNSLVELFDLPDIPTRIEVYDNSHISGTNPVGAMIVAGEEGFIKNAYRKFNIKGNYQDGDDYAMMREVFERRFSRALKEDPDQENNTWPSLILVDGGKGQLSAAYETLKKLGLENLPIFGVSKGPMRNAGREKFHAIDGWVFDLPQNDPVLFFLQRLRDESHRFVIGAHRTRRKKDLSLSSLDSVPGIGAKRKKALLLHFGSAKAVENAGIEDLKAVEGISQSIAQTIYDFFHEQ